MISGEIIKRRNFYHDEDTNLIIQGGVDDVWFDLDTNQLVVADYKAQSTKYDVEKDSYLRSQYHHDIKYRWIFMFIF